MPLFATCTIENAILALCAPPGTLTFSSWACAVPLRFDTLASSRLACRIPSGCCRALHCVPVSRCNAGGSVYLLACHAAAPVCAVLAADLARPCGCSCGRATSAVICHGYRTPAYLAGDVRQTVHADHCDGFDQAWLNGRGELTAQCLPYQQSPTVGLRHVWAVAARQRAALRLAAAIVHVAHACIANL